MNEKERKNPPQYHPIFIPPSLGSYKVDFFCLFPIKSFRLSREHLFMTAYVHRKLNSACYQRKHLPRVRFVIKTNLY